MIKIRKHLVALFVLMFLVGVLPKVSLPRNNIQDYMVTTDMKHQKLLQKSTTAAKLTI